MLAMICYSIVESKRIEEILYKKREEKFRGLLGEMENIIQI
jgi:hypothetical protein